ncbi:MAG: helix-turn-helix transcriptional regulator [Clostridium beijerinckii]|nr:helix-turn-helix transcriptional regulator [Clostridium beijerinckii]
MNIGENIKKFRKNKGMTQKQLAFELNKSERMIQKYESGEVEPSIDILNQISNVLGTSVMEFIDNDKNYVSSTPEGLLLKTRVKLNPDLINEIILQLVTDGEISDMLLLDGDLEFFTEEIKQLIISLAKFVSSKNRNYIFDPINITFSEPDDDSL